MIYQNCITRLIKILEISNIFFSRYNWNMNYDVVIVASGKGNRANLGYNKAFFVMKDNKTVIEHSASLFIEDNDCKNIIVVTSSDYFDQVFDNEKVIKVLGGKERKDSVKNGLSKVTSEYVLIHDAVRPFLNKESLQEVKNEVVRTNACLLGKMAIDTIKLVEDGIVVKTIDRTCVFQAATPQAFKSDLIKECYDKCDDVLFTDDASLVEACNHKVSIVIDKYDNKKLTMPEDFINLWSKK